MSADMDALVEALGHDVWCDYADKVPEGCTPDFGCGVWRKARHVAEAIGLPALLERVEAAEKVIPAVECPTCGSPFRDGRWYVGGKGERVCSSPWHDSDDLADVTAERDTLAAKVALTELERAALTHAIEVYTGPDDDTLPLLRSMLITRAATDDEPTHAQQMEAFGEMG